LQRHRRRRHEALQRVRSRIAADLHDNVGAGLSRIAILSEVVRMQVAARVPESEPTLTSIGDTAREVVGAMNDAVWFIDPQCDTLQHLIVRLRTVAVQLFDATNTTCSISAHANLLVLPLSPDQRRNLYMILKEALTNVRRHAHASNVTVCMTRREQQLRIEIVDDGVGLPTIDGGTSGGNGITNMQHRAADLGGMLVMGAPADGTGTRTVLEIPYWH
jgi:signal transduction histidine kinase